MAERTILVCDVCGEPAADTVTIRVGTSSLWKDLCKRHISELVANTRRPRRGRPSAAKAATKESAAPKAKARTRTRAKRATRRGRKPAAQAASS